MKNQDIKQIQKSAKKSERKRWAKMITEKALKKDNDPCFEYTHQVLMEIAACMENNNIGRMR